MVKKRIEIVNEDCWNLASLYPSFEAWEREYKKFTQQQPHPFQKILTYRGRLHEGASICFECINLYMDTDRTLSKLHTYAHLRHDEDTGVDLYKEAYGKIRLLYFDFQKETSWIEPQLIALPGDVLYSFLEDPLLKSYKFYFEHLLRLKLHRLSEEQEMLLALAFKALQAPKQIFFAYNNADIVFESIQDAQGQHHTLSHGSYLLYMQSQDRVLRKNAFEALHRQYQLHENSLTEMLQGQVQKNIFEARARKYPDALSAALFPQHIDENVYHQLIATVHQRLDSMHRYMDFRKRALSVDKLYGYDMNVSCVRGVDLSIPFNQAVEWILESVSILGDEYVSALERGFKQDRWVDRYENARKRSGAYSSGCYDSNPYILMNYQGTVSDVMTLAHEAGHSMHSWLSAKHQPYHYYHYSIFVAEVASTFNEELLFRYLLKKMKTEEEKIFLINKKLDGIRATLFRQTLFAEFELKIHELSQQGQPLTPLCLKTLYGDLNKKYYGESFHHEGAVQYECLRIPHFYSDFYVYQYATGISASYALVEKVLQENDPRAYLTFLSSGSSQYPLDLLKEAGVDMHSSSSLHLLIDNFDRWLEVLLKDRTARRP